MRDAGEPRAVIFDMEGVLVDSERSPHAAWHRLWREEGGQPDPGAGGGAHVQLLPRPSKRSS